ncbi:MAG: carbohydrate kinase [Deltaproteobacteria bacterium]|nr:carbohydrate kinase [Candidatus Zymogenaceae bacterium]
MPAFVTMGELLVDFISVQRGQARWLASVGGREESRGETGRPMGKDEAAPAFIPSPGGAPANVAAGLSRLGKDAGFIGKVGDDPFGRGLADVLSGMGVDIRAVSFSTQARTMLAFVTLSASGERDFVFFRHPSADMLISPDDVPKGYLAGAACFHFGSISLIDQPARSTTLGLIDAAKGAGALVSFDPNIRFSLFSDEAAAKRTILEAIPLADILKLSEEEAAFLTGQKTPKNAALALLSMGPGLVAVTGGNRGSVAVTAHYAVEVDAYEVGVVDTTGAGDAFCAAMLAAFSETSAKEPAALTDLDLIRMFQRANAAGAIAVTRPGAIGSLPTAGEIDLFIRTRKELRSSGTLH